MESKTFFEALQLNKQCTARLKGVERRLEQQQRTMYNSLWRQKELLMDDYIHINVRTPSPPQPYPRQQQQQQQKQQQQRLHYSDSEMVFSQKRQFLPRNRWSQMGRKARSSRASTAGAVAAVAQHLAESDAKEADELGLKKAHTLMRSPELCAPPVIGDLQSSENLIAQSQRDFSEEVSEQIVSDNESSTVSLSSKSQSASKSSRNVTATGFVLPANDQVSSGQSVQGTASVRGTSHGPSVPKASHSKPLQKAAKDESPEVLPHQLRLFMPMEDRNSGFSLVKPKRLRFLRVDGKTYFCPKQNIIQSHLSSEEIHSYRYRENKGNESEEERSDKSRTNVPDTTPFFTPVTPIYKTTPSAAESATRTSSGGAFCEEHRKPLAPQDNVTKQNTARRASFEGSEHMRRLSITGGDTSFVVMASAQAASGPAGREYGAWKNSFVHRVGRSRPFKSASEGKTQTQTYKSASERSQTQKFKSESEGRSQTQSFKSASAGSQTRVFKWAPAVGKNETCNKPVAEAGKLCFTLYKQANQIRGTEQTKNSHSPNLCTSKPKGCSSNNGVGRSSSGRIQERQLHPQQGAFHGQGGHYSRSYSEKQPSNMRTMTLDPKLVLPLSATRYQCPKQATIVPVIAVEGRQATLYPNAEAKAGRVVTLDRRVSSLIERATSIQSFLAEIHARLPPTKPQPEGKEEEEEEKGSGHTPPPPNSSPERFPQADQSDTEFDMVISTIREAQNAAFTTTSGASSSDAQKPSPPHTFNRRDTEIKLNASHSLPNVAHKHYRHLQSLANDGKRKDDNGQTSSRDDIALVPQTIHLDPESPYFKEKASSKTGEKKDPRLDHMQRQQLQRMTPSNVARRPLVRKAIVTLQE